MKMRHSVVIIGKTSIRAKLSFKRHALFVRDLNGNLRELRSEDTLWYLFYVSNLPVTKQMKKLFRNRFHILYYHFLYLCEYILEHPLFTQWTHFNCTGIKFSDVRFIILGFLHYIGRDWNLDNVYEANRISREVNWLFLKKIHRNISIVLYRKWVLELPREKHVRSQEQFFGDPGFNWCISSIDAIYVPMLSCLHWVSNVHKGFNLHIPACSYNITVDHSRWILGSTLGHPSIWNDKTLILYNELISNVNDRKIPDYFELSLLENMSITISLKCNTVYFGLWWTIDI